MKKDLPIVSVAIIAYNQKDYLKACIESIIEQDYNNIEIVVADDCSTDGTQDMLKEYDEKYPNKFILRLSETNQGITNNSNLAHFSCSGKYIAWMGGDDLMLPGKLRKQVEHMESNHECNISYHNLDVFQSETNETLYYFNKKNIHYGDVRQILKYGTFNGACSNMVRREKAPSNGFDKRIPIASDWLYWAETLMNGGEIHYIDEVLGRYRRHENNVTNILSNDAYRNQIDHLNSCNILLIKAPQYNKEILFRYSEIARSLRLKDKNNYMNFLSMSLRVGFNIKAFILLFVFIVTFGGIKK